MAKKNSKEVKEMAKPTKLPTPWITPEMAKAMSEWIHVPMPEENLSPKKDK